MKEIVKKRCSFSDIDIINTAYIEYEPHKVVPSCEDYVDGEERSLVLRNKLTGELEQIEYVLCGVIPFDRREGYLRYFGQIKSEDVNCYLVFEFVNNGDLESIHASFAGRSPNQEEFNKANETIEYAAQITTKW